MDPLNGGELLGSLTLFCVKEISVLPDVYFVCCVLRSSFLVCIVLLRRLHMHMHKVEAGKFSSVDSSFQPKPPLAAHSR